MAVDREALARALREARENYGMSQEAVAKRVGLSRTVLAQIELGNRWVSEDELSRLSSVYGKALSDFEATSRARGASRFSVVEFAPELLDDEDDQGASDSRDGPLYAGVRTGCGFRAETACSSPVTNFRRHGTPLKPWSKDIGRQKKSAGESVLEHCRLDVSLTWCRRCAFESMKRFCPTAS